ncbi:UDP-2,3-diacylglucosamine hydrolase [Candidatus Blochmanniella vafra str. BVAF]|uniref:UDP-2,3-diacylglucosamine hydrolase n=1 Tax=Blochmanniella vafra (strain BVAF) TaxID=859654 RepID=E8Q6V7_BLOVB|nr:UDP-2,3-diacylglucosamine diphosphatase [Candidatus Blochmannia vafer]ADV33704.1 UDP-2,3-diacylglucosamine hydrolase [Candidatus Blochmannia vafer str. BVAF]
MSILFISDVHLHNNKPKIIKGFLNFLRIQATQAKALYILGDLFEIWLGDDNDNSMCINIAKGLKSLNKKKIPCYFIRGNRDFLLGEKYANACGMILLPDNPVLKLPSGKNIVILHGDTLCIYDKPYQRLRVFLRCRIIQKLFLSLPLSVRFCIYNFMNSYVTRYNQSKSKNKLNISTKKAIDILMKNQSQIMIHGHTHQPAIHNIYFYKEKKILLKRIVLGCWNRCGSVVRLDDKNDNIALVNFPLDYS